MRARTSGEWIEVLIQQFYQVLNSENGFTRLLILDHAATTGDPSIIEELEAEDEQSLQPTPQVDQYAHAILDQIECPICLNDSEGGEDRAVRLNRCTHTFHQTCIETWVNGSRENALHCTVCRQPIT